MIELIVLLWIAIKLNVPVWIYIAGYNCFD